MAILPPFNYKPESTFVRTIPYTIPSDSYARVTPMGVWFEVGGNVFGFEASSFDFDTGAVGTAFADSIFVNQTDFDIMIEANIMDTTGLTGSNYVAIYAGTIADATRPVGVPGTNPIDWEGVSDYRFVMIGTGSGAGVTQRSHIFKLPPQHTLRREVLHNQPNSSVTNIRAYSQTILKGEFWFEPGTDIDGDKFMVELYKSPD